MIIRLFLSLFFINLMVYIPHRIYGKSLHQKTTTNAEKSGQDLCSLSERLCSSFTSSKNLQLRLSQKTLGFELQNLQGQKSSCYEGIQSKQIKEKSGCLETKNTGRTIRDYKTSWWKMYCVWSIKYKLASHRLCSYNERYWLSPSPAQEMGNRQYKEFQNSLCQPSLRINHHRQNSRHKYYPIVFDGPTLFLISIRDSHYHLFQVKQCGNAVTPPAMEFLVQQCVESLN